MPMNDSTNDALEQHSALVLAAEKILSNSLGRSMRFNSIELLTDPDRRNEVYRCVVEPERDVPATYIIKKIAGSEFKTADLETWDVRRFFGDWVGAEFLDSIPSTTPISPKFYGGSLEMGFFILEDLGEHHSLVEPLLTGDTVQAQAALLKYATCLGKLHALTTGKANVFDALYTSKLPGLNPFAYELDQLETRVKNVQMQMEQLGVSIPFSYTDDILAIMDAISQPGPFLAFIHADPCPDNVFDLGDHFRLIDFEFSHFGHALLDAAYPRMIFTTCWCANRTPPEIVARFEQRYRQELIIGCPQARNDALWETALVHSCGYIILRTLAMHLEAALKEDSDWGRASFRQRVMVRLQAFVSASEQFQRLPSLRAAASQLLQILHTRWPETPELPLYPAFDVELPQVS